MIPKTVHHMWLGGKPLPEKYVRYLDTWKKYNPDFQFKVWRDEDVEKIWEHPELKQFKELFQKASLIEQCDVARYAVLYLEGGVYSDLNVECYKPIEPLLHRDLGLAYEPKENWQKYKFEYLMTNSLLMSKRGHPFWLALLHHIRENYWQLDHPLVDYVMINTGPYLLARFVETKWPQAKEELLDTCLVQPFANVDGQMILSEGCQKQNAYLAKIWKDTTGWGGKSLQGRFMTLKNDLGRLAVWAVLIIIFIALLIWIM